MKFDFCVGNPPYQGDNHMQIYPDFYLAGQQIAKCVDMIFPTGWQEPKNANNLRKMNTSEVKEDKQIVLIDNRQNAFPGVSGAEWTNIIIWKEGYDNGLNGKQRILTNGDDEQIVVVRTQKDGSEIPAPMLSVIKRVQNDNTFVPLSNIILRSESYRFTDMMHNDLPDIKTLLSKGHLYDLKSSVISKLNNIVFFDAPPADGHEYICILGLEKSKRVKKWMRKDYLHGSADFDKYKLFIAEAAASGKFGEKLSDAVVAEPGIGHTQTFISIGQFETKNEAVHVDRYIKTKFARALLFTLKNTQHNGVGTWANIPLQDFTSTSDIDWSVPVAAIDKQLYKKYGLSQEEIDFIETNVKEME